MKKAQESVTGMFVAILLIFFVAVIVLPLVGLWDAISLGFLEKCDKCGKRGKITRVARCHSDDLPPGKTVNDATLKICSRCRP